MRSIPVLCVASTHEGRRDQPSCRRTDGDRVVTQSGHRRWVTRVQLHVPRYSLLVAQQVGVGDTVYVPWALLDEDPGDYPSALGKGRVFAVHPHNVTLDMYGEQWVASKRALRTDVGVVVMRVGDFQTEFDLLDPLSKSVLHYLRLLLPPDCVTAIGVRSLTELTKWWASNHSIYGNVILIGHADSQSVGFFVEDDVSPNVLGNALDVPGVEGKVWVSLACKTGHANFAREFSQATACSTFIGPYHSVHGAVASHFAQSFYMHHIYRGHTTKKAFNKARGGAAGGVSFRRWEEGLLYTDSS